MSVCLCMFVTVGPTPWDYFPGCYDLISQDYVDKNILVLYFLWLLY